MSVDIFLNNDHNPDLSMNLSNLNFCALWDHLGLRLTETGTVDPDELLNALKKFKPSELVKASKQEGRNLYTLNQITKYSWKLSKLARKAKELDQFIILGY